MKVYFTLFMAFTLILFAGCSDEWLEERSSKSLVVPTALQDFQALLDNSQYMNGAHQSGGALPDMGEAGSDNHVFSDNIWNFMYIVYKNSYIWNSEIFEGETSLDWDRAYITVFYANTVFDGLANIEAKEQETEEYNNIRGSALFFRANAFFHLAQVFAKPYDATTAQNDLGIPLRLTSDFNARTTRASLLDTYDRVLEDLETALPLLPLEPRYKTRPSKAAAYGLRARIYLAMRDYDSAFLNADSCLSLYGELMDYNTLDVAANLPFLRFGPEVIFDASIVSGSLTDHIISPELYNMYDENDLRRIAYFRQSLGNLVFKGSYIRSAWTFFAGIATDEMYLIRAECSARNGNLASAMADLQTLLENRYDKVNGVSTYQQVQFSDTEQAVDFIINERRKELVFRGLRWMDLRRLNLEGRNITLTRVVNGTEYTLEPNSPRYTYPIPQYVIDATGIEQNER